MHICLEFLKFVVPHKVSLIILPAAAVSFLYMLKILMESGIVPVFIF